MGKVSILGDDPFESDGIGIRGGADQSADVELEGDKTVDK